MVSLKILLYADYEFVISSHQHCDFVCNTLVPTRIFEHILSFQNVYKAGFPVRSVENSTVLFIENAYTFNEHITYYPMTNHQHSKYEWSEEVYVVWHYRT